MSERRTRVLVAGGGVAALELILALRDLAAGRVEVDLLSAQHEFVYRPLAVAEPFGVGKAHRFDLAAIAQDCGARLRLGVLTGVEAQRGRALTADGHELGFDILAIAVGARSREGLPGALTFGGHESRGAFRGLLDELRAGGIGRLAFAVPGGTVWALPLYELALMTSTYAAARGLAHVQVILVTPEDAPLGIFGRAASNAIRALLRDRGIDVRTGASPTLVEDGRLLVTPGEPVTADRVVTLPVLDGPRLAGVPHDSRGFIPIDEYGRVEGLDAIFAAGDATTFPVKQGGIATQQADVAAEGIAAAAGAPLTPKPFRPVLRGVLLTGGWPAHLRAELRGDQGEASMMEMEPLWWPPSKVAGYYLSRYVATLVAAEPPPPEGGIQIEVDDLDPLLGPRRRQGA
jgi:sulfide:quinone oxidoreductase